VARLVCGNKRVTIGSRGRAVPKWTGTSARRKGEEKAPSARRGAEVFEFGDRRLNIVEAETVSR